MRKSILWMMAVTAGLVVANNYYNQPLLSAFAREFAVSERHAGSVAAVTQVGYAIGLLFLVPLGDKVERRKLICVSLAAATVALAAMAMSMSLTWMIGASLMIGMCSIAPQLLTPFAAHLAGPGERGKAVGVVMFGLLCGVLLSRTISGAVGAYLGWRAMYWTAAVVMLLLIAILYVRLPVDEPVFEGSYGTLMTSLIRLYRDEPIIRETSAIAALQFAAFSGFWTTLSFYLASMPGHYGSEVAGVFGLIGVVGASAAPYAGRLSDGGKVHRTVLISSLILVFAYLVMLLGGSSLLALVVGVIFLDLGMQSGHVSNMARNLSLNPATMSRANTLYMFIRFAGGASGAALGSFAWSRWHWPGVCCVGMALSLLSIGVQAWARYRHPTATE